MPIQAEIGLKTSPFLKGVQEVKAATEKMLGDTAAAQRKHAGGGHAGGHAFGALQGEMRAERNIGRLSQDILSAHSGSQMLALSLERVGHILHLGIGLGVAAHVAGFLIESNEKLTEQFEQLKTAAEGFGEASHHAIESGGFTDQIAQLAKGAKILADLGKLQHDGGTFKAFLGDVFSGSMFTGSMSERHRETAKLRIETQELQHELAEAAVEDLRFTAEIAELKAQGHDDEAAALERERKLKRELLTIEKSGLGEHQKHEAKELVTSASESGAAAADLAQQRAAQLATEKEITELNRKENDLIAERVRIGESEEEHAGRLVGEINSLVTEAEQLAAHRGTALQHESDALRIAQDRTTAAEKLNELAKLYAAQQRKNNDEDAARAKRREEATPGIVQNAYALAAAASGDQDAVKEVDRRTRYAKHLQNAKTEGFGEDDARRLAASQTRLEDLKEQQEKLNGSRYKGRGDADRRLGLGGYAERGSDSQALARESNRINGESKGLLAEILLVLRNQKPAKPDSASKFN